MAEEFQTGVCGGNWWMSTPRSVLTGSTSPCSVALNDTSGFAWSDMVDLKGRSCEETDSVSDKSVVFQDVQKPHQADSAAGGGSVLIDSTLQMMGFGFSSSETTATTDWNQALLRGSGKAESNYSSILQEEMNLRLNYQHERGVDSSQIQRNWSPKNFSGGGEDLSIAAFKSINEEFSLDTVSSTGSSTLTSQGLSAGFPVGSTSYGYPSTLLQGLFDAEPQPQPQPQHQPQQSVFSNRSMSYSSTGNYGTSGNELSPSWPKFPPFISKQQPCGLHFSNKTPFWNASTAVLSDNVRPGIFPSSQPQYLVPTFQEKPKCSNLNAKPTIEDVQDSVSVVKKSGCEPVFNKRPRIETPSPLPTFKVRKEKLGDRITALQQLVSPFGKTDTASVLHEAIEYIKFLHDQVDVLSTPYLKNGTPIQHQQGSNKLQKETEGLKQDLRSRGLCLVPISSTYPVANETTADFWTPTFGGTFR